MGMCATESFARQRGCERCRRITRFVMKRGAGQSGIHGVGGIAGRRHPERGGDIQIHGIDLDEVWNVASSRIPELLAVLDQFLAADPGSAPVS